MKVSAGNAISWAFVFVLLVSCSAKCDPVVVTGTANSSAEDHSYRQAVSLGDDLVFEVEQFGSPTNTSMTVPLQYSLASGFELGSAVLEFSLSGSLNSYVGGSSTPVDEGEPDFIPANLNAVIANTGPLVVVYIGDESFVLMSDVVSGTATVDLVALGYGDLILQGAPISVVTSVTLLSYIDAGQVPWWGRNAISEYSVDQYWSGEENAQLTFGSSAVPEPGSLLLVGSGLLLARRRVFRR